MYETGALYVLKFIAEHAAEEECDRREHTQQTNFSCKNDADKYRFQFGNFHLKIWARNKCCSLDARDDNLSETAEVFRSGKLIAHVHV